MLWQTALLVVVVLFIFAAVGTAAFASDFALGKAVEATRNDDVEDFSGCSTLGEVGARHLRRPFTSALVRKCLALTMMMPWCDCVCGGGVLVAGVSPVTCLSFMAR